MAEVSRLLEHGEFGGKHLAEVSRLLLAFTTIANPASSVDRRTKRKRTAIADCAMKVVASLHLLVLAWKTAHLHGLASGKYLDAHTIWQNALFF